jgi:hypothetical protein
LQAQHILPLKILSPPWSNKPPFGVQNMAGTLGTGEALNFLLRSVAEKD